MCGVVLVVMAVYVVVCGAVFVVDVELLSLERSSYRSCSLGTDLDLQQRRSMG